MSFVNELIQKAHELKSKGLTTHEIADELKVQPDTVVWLLLKGKEKAGVPAPFDVFVDWSPIGGSVKRLSLLGHALAELVSDTISKGVFESPDVVVGVQGSGMILGYLLAEKMEKPFSSVKPQRMAEKQLSGLIDSAFKSVENRKTLLVDTVIGVGEAVRTCVKTLSDVRAKTVAIAVLVNKSGRDDVDGLPIEALVRLLPVTGAPS